MSRLWILDDIKPNKVHNPISDTPKKTAKKKPTPARPDYVPFILKVPNQHKTLRGVRK